MCCRSGELSGVEGKKQQAEILIGASSIYGKFALANRSKIWLKVAHRSSINISVSFSRRFEGFATLHSCSLRQSRFFSYWFGLLEDLPRYFELTRWLKLFNADLKNAIRLSHLFDLTPRAWRYVFGAFFNLRRIFLISKYGSLWLMTISFEFQMNV